MPSESHPQNPVPPAHQPTSSDLTRYAVPHRVLAGLATWGFPGTGHFLLGQRQRGIVLACGIGSLYLIGLLVGGITVANPAFESGPNSQQFLYWFQFFMMPNTLLVAWENSVIQNINGIANLLPNTNPAFTPSYGRVREIGVLYLALAGLLNFLAIIDIVLNPRLTPNPNPPTPQPQPHQPLPKNIPQKSPLPHNS